MKTWHWLSLAVLILAITVTGCGGGATGKGDAGGHVYDIKGTVTAVNPNKEKPTVKIDHEDIPGLMKAMQMEFAVEDPKLLDGIKVGDQVQGRLKKGESGYVLTQLQKRTGP